METTEQKGERRREKKPKPEELQEGKPQLIQHLCISSDTGTVRWYKACPQFFGTGTSRLAISSSRF
jgi:hypothetical protein